MAEDPKARALDLWREQLALRLPQPVCPMCGRDDWTDPEPITVTGEAVAFSCSNCGFIRLHTREL